MTTNNSNTKNNACDNGIKSITFWFNSYLSYESTTSLDADYGVVRFKTNFGENSYEGALREYESVFLCDKDLSKQFCVYADYILGWDKYYGKGLMIDGSYWKLTVTLKDGTLFQSKGENGQPDRFFEFVERYEELIQKDIIYRLDTSL